MNEGLRTKGEALRTINHGRRTADEYLRTIRVSRVKSPGQNIGVCHSLCLAMLVLPAMPTCIWQFGTIGERMRSEPIAKEHR